jgi:hypothetical protein
MRTSRKMACMWTGCERYATQQLRLRWWVDGHPKDSHQPCITDPMLVICDDHADFAMAQDWFSAEAQNALNNGMDRAAKARPDYKTAEAFLEPIPADSTH